VVRHVQPAKPAGPYLIGSYPKWWQLNALSSWQEPKFAGFAGTGPWISNMPATEVVARLDMAITDATGARTFTIGE
jgi:hypothetical protein